MAKRTTITIETNSLLILRACSVRRKWCPRCGAEAEMIAPAITPTSPDQVQDAIEKLLNPEELHRAQAEDGSTLVCLNSMLNRMQKTRTT
jgi:hypothetical protein